MDKGLYRLRVINESTLKIIAMACMLIDHTGAVFFPEIISLRIIGRLAFPLFAFMLVEGFFHTGNVLKYALRLLIVAFISEIPFDICFFNGAPLNLIHQNVFFNLFIGLMTVYAVDSFLKIKMYIPSVAVGAAGMLVAQLIRCDYGFKGVGMILAFYVIRMNTGIWVRLFMVLTIFFLNFDGIQTFAVLALIPIYFYNGNRGIKSPVFKYFAYLFYPVHLAVIALLRYFVYV